MTFENAITPETRKKLEELLASDVYRDNLEFWERAWGMVKNAYTQMPSLPYLDDIPARLQEQGSKTVLDLGCGSGWLSVFLARRGFSVTGLDISTNAIKLGRAWAADEKLDIQFDIADLADLPYPDSSFDAIVANSIFEHLPMDMAMATLARMRLLLVPGGIFLGCFDKVGGGPGEYYKLPDQTHVYTDKARKGMLLRFYSDEELEILFESWNLESAKKLENGSRFLIATT